MLGEENIENLSINPQSCVSYNFVTIGSMESNNYWLKNVLIVAKAIVVVVVFVFFSTSSLTRMLLKSQRIDHDNHQLK
jgi:hypothetical protein